MKGIFQKLQQQLVPVLLGCALILTGVFSAVSIKNLQGNARVINYTGIVRGATQRLIKKELNHLSDNTLILRLDKILVGLLNGNAELDLIRLQSPEYQKLLLEMAESWIRIKDEIFLYRKGKPGNTLLELSEDYFHMADHTVLAAEIYTEESVQSARKALLYMNLAFVFLALLSGVSAFYQEKRRRKLQQAEEKNREESEYLARLSKQILMPMNEISELMYISDIDTYDLLFINNAGKETFHLDDDKPRKCYEALQGRDAPCPFCTIPYLKEDENYTWEFTNPVLNRHFLLKDRLVEWGDRLARMEIAFDITDSANEKIELQHRLESDKILLECLREFYRNHNVQEATSYVLAQAGRLFGADRAYIFLMHDAYVSNTAEWCNNGIEPQIHNLQNIPQADFSLWFNMFSNRETLIIDDVNKLKGTMDAEYEILSKQGIQRVIMVPLEGDGKLSGFIGLDNPMWNLWENAVSFLQTLRYFLMLALRRSEDEEALSRLSYYDTLTSFYNRNRYIQDVGALQDQCGSVGVVFLDVNGLKEVNDNFGHDAGDRLLKECAEIIRRVFNSASFYRIGGDEFVVICRDISEREFDAVVHKLRNSFKDAVCQAAIGTRWTAQCGNVQAVIAAADERMYADKKAFYHTRQPSGRYRHHNDAFRQLAEPALLRQALAAGQFLVYLQPKMDTESARPVGAEALVRYRDEAGRVETPDAFIPVLEDAHLISRLDFHVFESVCRQIRAWQDQGRTPVPISCNFSRYSFMETSFVERLEAIRSMHGVAGEYLEIEITEGVHDVDYRALKAQIDRVRQSGFQVSVDNFGIKSSNLALLAMTSFDVLKIDKRFVKDIAASDNARKVVEALTLMCAKMNIRLTAEGVETEEQLAVLKECGIKTVQGFLFSRPLPMDEYERKYLA